MSWLLFQQTIFGHERIAHVYFSNSYLTRNKTIRFLQVQVPISTTGVLILTTVIFYFSRYLPLTLLCTTQLLRKLPLIQMHAVHVFKVFDHLYAIKHD